MIGSDDLLTASLFRYFREWGNEGEVEIRKVFSELIIMTASSCLMGPEIRENLSAEIARIYHSLDGGLTPLSTLWPGAPTQKHKERDEARKEMVDIFAKIIANRRSGAVSSGDFLQKIIEFRYNNNGKEGRGFTDAEVCSSGCRAALPWSAPECA